MWERVRERENKREGIKVRRRLDGMLRTFRHMQFVEVTETVMRNIRHSKQQCPQHEEGGYEVINDKDRVVIVLIDGMA